MVRPKEDNTTSMSPTRRDFIKATTSTAAALAVGKYLAANVGADARNAQAPAQTLPAPAADAAVIDLANEALNAARGAGASSYPRLAS